MYIFFAYVKRCVDAAYILQCLCKFVLSLIHNFLQVFSRDIEKCEEIDVVAKFEDRRVWLENE